MFNEVQETQPFILLVISLILNFSEFDLNSQKCMAVQFYLSTNISKVHILKVLRILNNYGFSFKRHETPLFNLDIFIVNVQSINAIAMK